MADKIRVIAEYHCTFSNSPNPVMVSNQFEMEEAKSEEQNEKAKAFTSDLEREGFKQCTYRKITEVKKPIRIGVLSSVAGGQAVVGFPFRNGAELAVEQVNSRGEIPGYFIEMFAEDDQSKQQEGPVAVSRLIQHDKVLALLTGQTSSNAMATVPIADEAHIPTVVSVATNPKVTVSPADGKTRRYIFRSLFNDDFQGRVMAHFAVEDLHARTAGIFTDSAEDYSVGISDSFRKSFLELGGTILIEEKYQSADQDFNAQMVNFKSQSPDILFIPDGIGSMGSIARQGRAMGVHSVFLGGDGWDYETLLTIGGNAIEGSYFSNHYSTDNPNPAIQSFLKAYREKFHEEPNTYAALGYEGALMLIDAIRRAGKPEPEFIRSALEATKDFPGITGKITINAQHDSDKPAVLLKVEGGKYKFVKTVKP